MEEDQSIFLSFFLKKIKKLCYLCLVVVDNELTYTKSSLLILRSKSHALLKCFEDDYVNFLFESF